MTLRITTCTRARLLRASAGFLLGFFLAYTAEGSGGGLAQDAAALRALLPEPTRAPMIEDIRF